MGFDIERYRTDEAYRNEMLYRKSWRRLEKADREGKLSLRPRKFSGTPLVINGRKHLTGRQAQQYLGLNSGSALYHFLRRFEAYEGDIQSHPIALTDLQAIVELSPFIGKWSGPAVIGYARQKRHRDRWVAEQARNKRKEAKSET